MKHQYLGIRVWFGCGYKQRAKCASQRQHGMKIKHLITGPKNVSDCFFLLFSLWICESNCTFSPLTNTTHFMKRIHPDFILSAAAAPALLPTATRPQTDQRRVQTGLFQKGAFCRRPTAACDSATRGRLISRRPCLNWSRDSKWGKKDKLLCHLYPEL